MQPAYEYGDEVRLIRNVRNDGTYPGKEVGELLIRRGAVGCVFDVGTYLQDQMIYRVHFLEEGKTVGCRQEELIPASDPWIPNQFEFREYVVNLVPISSGGEVLFPAGSEGSIVKVIRDETSVLYHVNFGTGRVFQMPEAALAAAEKAATAETTENEEPADE